MSLKDAFNNKFALPDMGDYYYDAPDQQKFLEKMNAGINPYSPHDTTSDAAAAYKFYHEDPPMNIGYDKDHMTYMGVKLINAFPMNRQEYNDFRGWQLPADENGAEEGYLVEYLDGGKPNTGRFAGYVSWSPKEVF